MPIENNPADNTVDESNVSPLSSKALNLTQWALMAWALGVSLLLFKLVRSWFHYSSIVQRAKRVEDQVLKALVPKCASLLGLKRKIPVIETNEISTPAIFGVLRPKLLLPVGTKEKYTRQELQHIVLHELAHMKRLDPIWNLWATLIQIIHWPNPAVWYAVARQRGDRELATDFLALKSMGTQQPKEYGKTILKALESVSRQRVIPGLIGIAEDRRGLKRRFSMIASFQVSRRYSLIILSAVMLPLILIGLTDPKTAVPPVKDKEISSSNETPIQPTSSPQLEEGERTVEIIVRDAVTQQPLPGIPVAYTFDNWVRVQTLNGRTTTDSNGKALLHISGITEALSPLTIMATPKDHYVSQWRTWMPTEKESRPVPNQHNFWLVQGHPIGGTIVDYEGNPAPDIVMAFKWDIRSSPINDGRGNINLLYSSFENQLKTNSQGRWTFSGAPSGLQGVELTTHSPSGAKNRYHTGILIQGERIFPFGSRLDIFALNRNTSRIQLPEGKDLQVIVKNESGQPIANATAQEVRPTQNESGPTLITDHSGRAHFTGRSAREIAILIKHPEYAHQSASTHLKEKLSTLEIILATKKPLSGRVANTEGTPIEGARIEIAPRFNSSKVFSNESVHTGTNGVFYWAQAPVSKVFYRVSATGYQPQIFEWENQRESLEIALAAPGEQGGMIQATVVDAKSGFPIESFQYAVASNYFENPTLYLDPANPTSTELAPGQLSIPSLSEPLRFEGDQWRSTEYMIQVHAPGYLTKKSRSISIYERNPTVEIRLEPHQASRTLEGIRIFDSTGAPATRLPVNLARGFNGPPSVSIQADRITLRQDSGQEPLSTDHEGFLRNIILPPEFQNLIILDERGSISLTLEELSQPLEAITLSPLGSIRGVLEIANRAMPDQSVFLEVNRSHTTFFGASGICKTDKDGHFEFTKVPTGDYRLFLIDPRLTDRISKTYQKEITVNPGATTEADYSFNEGTEVRGRMLTDPGSAELDWQSGYYSLRKIVNEEMRLSRPYYYQFAHSESFSHSQRAFNSRNDTILESLKQDYYLKVEPNGYFSISGVAPGDYLLDLQPVAFEHGVPPGRRAPVGNFLQTVSIPEVEGLSHIDIGTFIIPVSNGSQTSNPVGRKTDNLPPSTEVPKKTDPTIRPHDLQIDVIDWVTNEPIPFISIEVEEKSWYQDSSRKIQNHSFSTDAKGTAWLRHIDSSANSVRILIQAPGYVAQERNFFLRRKGLPEALTFKLERGKEIVGYVKDEQGNPVPDVDVQLQIAPGYLQQFASYSISISKTDGQGRWSYHGIPVSAKSVNAKFSHPRLALDPKHSGDKLGGATARIRCDRPNQAPDQISMVLGGQIRGQVLNEAKKPITSASVRLVNTGDAPAKTNHWGWFQFPGSFAGPLRVQVAALGFAPRLVEIEVSPETPPFEIILTKGNRVHFKIIDPSGTPIPKVSLFAMSWEKTNSPLRLEQGITDENGEYTWMSGPPDSVDFVINLEGYDFHQEEDVTPRKEPYIITLTPTLIASFNVSDEDVEPLGFFSIFPGQLFRLPSSSKIEKYWAQNPKFGALGHAKISTQQQSSTPGTLIPNQFIYRIEALGYEPTETRIVNLDESPFTFDIQLKKRIGHLGMLTDMDNRPIPDEWVSLIALSQQPSIKQGRNPWKTDQATPLKTNSRGQFYVPSESINKWLLVTSEEGFLLSPNTLTAQQLVIQPWSKITGTVVESDQAVTNQRLGFRLVLPKGSTMKSPTFSDRALTKADGSFAFDRVPPGLIEIIAIPKETRAPSTGRVIHSIELEPGSTESIHIDLDLP
ncbi:carboxypeptidase regulatory-like domain-containing protein [Verrucomicrobia bacterium]|nr:carboxypeptidase regulatory-like domain-containing protein [Verrucomicrobiota bacterium]